MKMDFRSPLSVSLFWPEGTCLSFSSLCEFPKYTEIGDRALTVHEIGWKKSTIPIFVHFR